MHVLAELHQDEPVPEPEVLHDGHHVVAAAGLGSAAENQIPRIPRNYIFIHHSEWIHTENVLNSKNRTCFKT